MKILVTTGDFSQYLVPNFFNLLSEAAKYTELEIWHESGNIQDILGQLNTQPDFIFINEFGETNSPTITGLSSLKIPYAILLYDLHYNVEIRRKIVQKLNAKYIFCLYRDKFYEWYPSFSDRMIWFPHHVNTKVFKDYGMPKDINYLLMGDMNERIYPLRNKILKKMTYKPGLVYHEHPGWRNFSANEKDMAYVGERYAREINRAKIFLTCDSIYKYPLLKYYEILACNTLLLAPASNELTDLGFIAGRNFISIDETDFEDKAEYYLNHESERLEIAQRGYEMVRTQHSTAKRAIEFVKKIEEILRSY
ncbi:MAG: glycosyltransferase [Syntrophomonas sp.]|nr:glycosyltransferase [Syntrophomonas sp.]